MPWCENTARNDVFDSQSSISHQLKQLKWGTQLHHISPCKWWELGLFSGDGKSNKYHNFLPFFLNDEMQVQGNWCIYPWGSDIAAERRERLTKPRADTWDEAIESLDGIHGKLTKSSFPWSRFSRRLAVWCELGGLETINTLQFDAWRLELGCYERNTIWPHGT